ncbi:MAG: hypothetical protein ACO1NM_12405 [Sphingobium phenoxybenzoativorans]|uniref:hypothetical protein n=1 Tax=Sphingobium phenoxybenzoativorans TaxID=1592790 RepID=UPI000873225F|nr:hypothetical protein [Sphingobium phenoxybenzoativorans]
MAAREFVRACKEERDALLAMFSDASAGTIVGQHLDAAQLNSEQRRNVIAALDAALTDTFYTLLMGLAGEASLGGRQQAYRLSDEMGRPISPSEHADLGDLAFEAFQAD